MRMFGYCLEMESNSAMVNMLMAANMPHFPTVDATTELLKEWTIMRFLSTYIGLKCFWSHTLRVHTPVEVWSLKQLSHFVMWRNSIAKRCDGSWRRVS